MEYLVTMTTHVPDGTSDAAVEEIRTREAAHSSQLAAEGHLLRLWRPPVQPGQWRTLGLFAAGGAAELESVLLSMPLRVWRTDKVLALSPHPNDPGPENDQPRPILAMRGCSEFLTTFTIEIPPGTPGARGSMPRRRARPIAHGNSARTDSYSGSGGYPTMVKRSGCGWLTTPARCREFWRRYH
jgi:muconolactone delta-isomerase